MYLILRWPLTVAMCACFDSQCDVNEVSQQIFMGEQQMRDCALGRCLRTELVSGDCRLWKAIDFYSWSFTHSATLFLIIQCVSFIVCNGEQRGFVSQTERARIGA